MNYEDLLPPLSWDGWDGLPTNTSSNQRYRIPSEKVQQQIFEDAVKRFGNDSEGKKQAVAFLRNQLKLSPNNYIPPRHALEPHMGFNVDPNNAYRFLGETITVPKGVNPSSLIKEKTIALQDFLSTGQVRGNPTRVNGGRVFLPAEPNGITWSDGTLGTAAHGKELPQAYFMPRHPQPTYYTPSIEAQLASDSPYAHIGITSSRPQAIGQNTMIEISKDFAPIDQRVIPNSKNSLYYMGNQDSADAIAFRARGGLFESNTGAGAHITVNPRENPTFGEVADFRNRNGIRILQETAPALSMEDKIALNQRAIYGKVPNSWSGTEDAVLPSQEAGLSSTTDKIKWGTKYDRITPFSQRPVATHLANAKAEAEIIYNAAKYRPMARTGLGALQGKMGALNATGKVAGGIFVPLQIGMQINALTEKNVMDKEYGHSDPLSLRPLIDLGLSGIGNNQTPSQGLKSMEELVADPEWQMRNPIAAVSYNLAFGNTAPAKAFIDAYKPFFNIK